MTDKDTYIYYEYTTGNFLLNKIQYSLEVIYTSISYEKGRLQFMDIFEKENYL
jgi:hypothetical protein